MKTRLAAVAMAATNIIERSIICSDGVKLSAQHWISESPTNDHKIICLHGWLDNSASFHLLAPALTKRGLASEILALDFPGHGLSSHKSPDAPPQLLAEYVFYVMETASRHHWDKFTVIGHSMGAGVSVVLSAAFPEKVTSLVLLEGAAPLARNARDFSKHVRNAVEKRSAANKVLYVESPPSAAQHLKSARIYANLETAANIRVNTARLSPGRQYISKDAARVMVERATVPAPSGGEAVIFRHDPRLQWPSLQYSTREQVEGLLEDIQCPTCFLQAEHGWPIDKRSMEGIKRRLELKAYHKLPGSHHFHADPDTAGDVIDRVEDFLTSLK
mmetsp:Transcript_25293/g.30596  ORF Transcript_25293/g.30596 Transcript_25293/m.30596 type:complete len:331 (-) Transcript_25293:100-1092(-)